MNVPNPLTEANEVKSLVFSGKCVAFVGSGLSKPPGSTGPELVKKLAHSCCIPLDSDEPWQVTVDRCIEKDERTCNAVLKDELPRDVATARMAMVFVYGFPFKALLTTNFDPWIRDLDAQDRYEWYTYPHLPMHLGLSKPAYRLHGYFDSESTNPSIRSLVLGQRSFCEAYEQSLLPGFLLNVFVYEHVLFLGFDPTEQNIARLLQRSIGIRRAIASSESSPMAGPKRFILWARPGGTPAEETEKEISLTNEIRSLDITFILYDKRATDHRGLDAMLRTWREEYRMPQRKDPFKQDFDPSR